MCSFLLGNVSLYIACAYQIFYRYRTQVKPLCLTDTSCKWYQKSACAFITHFNSYSPVTHIRTHVFSCDKHNKHSLQSFHQKYIPNISALPSAFLGILVCLYLQLSEPQATNNSLTSDWWRNAFSRCWLEGDSKWDHAGKHPPSGL